MRTTAILNLKGGVGKTTTAVNMAAILADDYHRGILIVDADSQANSTEFFQSALRERPALYDLLLGDLSVKAQPVRFGVGLIPADDRLMDLDLSKLENGNVDAGALQKWLEPMRKSRTQMTIGGLFVDHVLIDCPPAFNAACAAALLAADDVIIPIKLDAFSLRGMANLMRQIQNMRAINPRLRLAGLLPTMIYKSEKISAALETLRASDLFVFPGIRKTNKVDDMTFAQRPLIESSPKSAACVDYRRFVKVYVEQEGVANNG